MATGEGKETTMLASNYLPADRLRITDRCRAALIQLLRKLETGEITKDDFKMDALDRCFYGHAKRIDSISMPPVDHLAGGLLNLCFPFDCTLAFKASRSQGAHALRNFLVTGRAYWPAVMDTLPDPNLATQWTLRTHGNTISIVPVVEREAA